MSVDPIRAVIEAESRALGPTLHTGMATSLLAADGHMGRLRHTKYPHMLPMRLRCELREFLEEEGLPAGWRTGGDPRLMAQLFLSNDDLGLKLRVLKERRRTYPGGVPVAGRNAARREQWIAEPLPLELPLAVVKQQRKGPIPLLLLWDFAGEDLTSFSLRIVHTLEAGVYGKRVALDLNLEVQTGGTIFDRLAFRGSPEDDDLFGYSAELDEGEEGLGG